MFNPAQEIYDMLEALEEIEERQLQRDKELKMATTQNKTQEHNVKDTNPKDAVGIKKAPLSTVSGPVIMEMGLAMLEGARKYGRHNYRVSGVRASVYFDATIRHLIKWWEGEDEDRDSGLNHIIKAMTSLHVLRDSMIMGNWVDDRPPPSPENFIENLNAKAAEIVNRYPDAVPAFTKNDVRKKNEDS